jgi:hypothetical protein
MEKDRLFLFQLMGSAVPPHDFPRGESKFPMNSQKRFVICSWVMVTHEEIGRSLSP